MEKLFKEKYQKIHGNSKYHNILTKKFLIKEYIENKKSTEQIAKEMIFNREIIWRYLIKYNIPRRTQSEAMKGKYKGNKNPFFGKHFTKKNKLKMKKLMTGRKLSKETKAKMRKASLKNWKNKEYREKVIKNWLKAIKLKPNKKEKQLNKLLFQSFPNEYKFVGDGKLIIGGFCPDFVNINGQKKIVEMYGDYWHNLPKQKKLHEIRLRAYTECGYKTLIIWEHELKDLNKLKYKIQGFHCG